MSLDVPSWEAIESLYELSKNLKGSVTVIQRKKDICKPSKSESLKVKLTLEAGVGDGPCDSAMGKRLDGKIIIKVLTQVLISGIEGRGAHYGEFVWNIRAGEVRGQITGITNAGTHRSPFLKCEECHTRGHMEGLLKGVIRCEGPLNGCRVLCSYSMFYEPQEKSYGITGAIEGIIICNCQS